MARSTSWLVLMMILILGFVSVSDSRKVLRPNTQNYYKGSLFQSLGFILSSSSPSNKEHAKLHKEKLFVRHLSRIDRILQSVPSPGAGHWPLISLFNFLHVIYIYIYIVSIFCFFFQSFGFLCPLFIFFWRIMELTPWEVCIRLYFFSFSFLLVFFLRKDSPFRLIIRTFHKCNLHLIKDYIYIYIYISFCILYIFF